MIKESVTVLRSPKEVMKALTICSGGGENCTVCPFFGSSGCISEMNRDALRLIRQKYKGDDSDGR